jgi:hypothetical protein
MEKNALANGFITRLNKTMDIVKHASKKKMKKDMESRKILILISCLIVKELANKKAYKFKRLITVKQDIAKSVLIS